MTAPLRRSLLNRLIAIEARRIAHAATATCRNKAYDYKPGTDHDDEHTPKCNVLKREIEALAMQIKLAGLQPPETARPEQERDQEEDRDSELPTAGDVRGILP